MLNCFSVANDRLTLRRTKLFAFFKVFCALLFSCVIVFCVIIVLFINRTFALFNKGIPAHINQSYQNWNCMYIPSFDPNFHLIFLPLEYFSAMGFIFETYICDILKYFLPGRLFSHLTIAKLSVYRKGLKLSI